MCGSIPMHSLYTSNFNQSRRLLDRIETDDDFAVMHEFLEEMASSPACKGNDLNSYLIMPVQRVYVQMMCRYSVCCLS